MNLNGPADRKDVEAFAAQVLAEYDGWVQDWTASEGGHCERRRRFIFLPERLIHGGPEWEAREYVLHEVAHIESGEAGDGHGSAFYEAYVGLLKRWMCNVME